MNQHVNELVELGFLAIQLKENEADYMKAISEGKFRFIFCCAEGCLINEGIKKFVEISRPRARYLNAVAMCLAAGHSFTQA